MSSGENINDIITLVAEAAEKKMAGQAPSGFSENAVRAIDALIEWCNVSGSMNLEIKGNVGDSMREMRDAVMDSLMVLTMADLGEEYASSSVPEIKTEEIKRETPKGPKIKINAFSPAPKNQAAPQSQGMQGIPETLKSNLEKALALKNAEFARDRLLLSCLPSMEEGIKAGLGMDLIYQQMSNLGYAGSKQELADWINSRIPLEGYKCTKCSAIIMKTPVTNGYSMEMEWICPECGEKSEKRA